MTTSNKGRISRLFIATEPETNQRRSNNNRYNIWKKKEIFSQFAIIFSNIICAIHMGTCILSPISYNSLHKSSHVAETNKENFPFFSGNNILSLFVHTYIRTYISFCLQVEWDVVPCSSFIFYIIGNEKWTDRPRNRIEQREKGGEENANEPEQSLRCDRENPLCDSFFVIIKTDQKYSRNGISIRKSH